MTRPWEQYDVPDLLQDRTASHPFIQWVNRGSTLTPAQDRGGWAMPTDQAAEALIPGTDSQLSHGKGHTTAVVYADALRVAPIRTRFCWVKDGDRMPDYVGGARGKLQVLCLTPAHDSETIVGPYMLTVKGMTSKQLSGALKEHSRAVRRLTNGKGQPWMFWLTLAASDTQMVGSSGPQSPITTLIRGGELRETDFVGHETVQRIITLAEEAEAWVAAWRNGNGYHGEGEEDAGGDEWPRSQRQASMALEAALKVRTPVSSRSFPSGTELLELVRGGEPGLGFLKWLKSKQRHHPQAAAAAAIILADLQRALFHARYDDQAEDTLPF